ncbi:MAG: CHAT domain-containing protein [Bacteroidetes bacterium]|nr:CHAT domain-containing protein [Bacteroidota bacterium]
MLVLLALVTTGATAQDPSAYIQKEIWLGITETYQTHDTIIARLSNAGYLPFVNGTILRAFHSQSDGDENGKGKKEFNEAGSGFVYISSNEPYLVIRLYKETDTLEAGDIVKISLSVPALPYRSIFSDLAAFNLILTHADKTPVFSLDQLLRYDSPAVEDSLYTAMIRSFRETYELVAHRDDTPPIMTQRITTGRFANRIPLDILRDVTRQELESFFLYMIDYPVGYIGKAYRASESFTGWVVSNSPYSAGEIQRMLLPLHSNNKEFAKKVNTLKRDLLSEHSAKQIAFNALELSDQHKFDEANRLTDMAVTMAEMVKDTGALPTVYICKAQVLLDDDKYAQSIIWCDKAIKAAQLAKDYDIELQALTKKGYCLYRVSKYKEAEQLLTATEQKIQQYRSKLEDEKYYSAQRKILEYRSSIRYRTGKYEEALRLLDTAILFNQRINSYDALVTNAGYYLFFGKVFNQQGRPGNALEAFAKADSIYRICQDWRNNALVKNEIAYSHFKMGNYRVAINTAQWAKLLLGENDPNNAGYSESICGSAWRELGMYDSALVAHQRSIYLRQLSGNLEGQAFSWEKMGALYKLSGSKTVSLQAYDTALFYYRLLRDSTGMADVFNAKGDVFLGDENYKKATDWFEQARGVSPKSTVEALYKLGVAWNSIDTAKSRFYYQQALKKSAEDGNTSYQFYANRSLGMLSYRLHNKTAGDAYYKECLALDKEMNTAYTHALCLSMEAYRYECDTELDSALLYYKKAMIISDTADRSLSVSLLNDMAGVHISKGEFSDAEKAYGKALQLAIEMSDSLSLGSTLQSASFLYSLTAEFDKGMLANDSAIAIFGKTGMNIRLANSFAARGTLYGGMGDNKASIQYYLKADSLFREEYQQEQRLTVFNNIGVIYNAQGDYTKALKYLQQSLVISGKDKMNENYLLVQGNIAEALAGLNRNAEACSLLLGVLPGAKKMQLHRIASGMALTLGQIYLKEDNLRKATEYFAYAADYARKSGEQDKMITALINLGRIAKKENQPEEARKNFRQSVALARQYRTTNAWLTFYEQGLLFYEEKTYDSAVVYFKEAVELLDKMVANLYGGEEAKKLFNNDPRKSDLYNKIVFSYYNLGNIKESWSYANRSNIAGIKELSGSLGVNSGDEEKNEALRKLLALQHSKKALENNLEKQEGQTRKETLKKIEILEADYNNFLQDVVMQYPELSTYFSRSNADEFNNYKGKLPEDVAVILYLQNGNTLMIFTLTNEKLAVDTMTINIAPRVNAFINAVKNTQKQTGTGPLSERSEPADEAADEQPGDFKKIADELYGYLVGTVEDKIAGKKKLCIIPSGIFSNLPFQCLGKKTGIDGFRFLLEDKLIFYTNKMSVFNNARQSDSGDRLQQSFAAFGVPDARLQFNISEVKNIGRILGTDSTVYADGRATESRAKNSLRHKKYIHFATHGVLNYSSDYSQSYLKLLPDKDTADGNNGQLTMREIQRLGIKDCDMVILSACQTAVSKELVEGWSISPANSFLVSHVRSVVASLWKVADEPTGLLMEYFYANMREGLDKGEALRKAQIKLSQDFRFRHPNYWGAFVLYGEWR